MRLRGLTLCVCLVFTASACGSVAPADREAGPSSATATEGAPSASASVTASATAPSTADRAAVRAAFETYTQAALEQDGATAVSMLASPIFGFYDRARESALTGTEEEVSRGTVTQQLTVYLLRAEVDPAVLKEGSVEEILRIAIDKGLVGEQGIRELDLGDIEVDGDEATAEARVGGQTTPFELAFLRENGTWKIDIEPLLGIADEAFRLQADQQGVSTDALIEDFLVSKYGPRRADALRDPLTS